MSDEPTTAIVKPIGVGIRGIVPANTEELVRLSTKLANTKAIPAAFQGKPDDCLAAIQLGMELGMPPMQALRSVMVVNGRATVWGDALLGLCQASGVFDHQVFKETIVGDGDKMVASCTVGRKGCAPTTHTFSMEQAKKAGLTAKNGGLYNFYPARMLKARARAFALRDTFADVLMGMYTAEEFQDDPRFVESSIVGGDAPVGTKADSIADSIVKNLPKKIVDVETIIVDNPIVTEPETT